MDILNKPINIFSFEDVVAFCKTGHPEGVEIDYKRDYPPKGLQKHIAAFANTRGGIVILGVEEDSKTGKPVKWDGIADDAKLVERANQESCNLSPLPSCQIHKTNPNKDGRVFILIRVLEGDKTPYYVQNDPNIWIRTGNISTPIDISSPEWTELLIGKQEKATKARNNYLKMAGVVFEEALKREERKRQRLIAEAKEKNDGSDKNYYQKQLGTDVGMCEITILPYFPREALITPQEIIDKVEAYVYSKGSYEGFPDRNLEPIPEGALHFKHSYNGYVECQQVYSKGLLYNKLDVMRVDEHGRKVIFLSFLAGRLFIILKTAQNFYGSFGYQGVLKLSVSLSNVGEMFIKPIHPDGFFFWDEDKECLLNDYSWEFELDTRILNDEDKFKQFYAEAIRNLYWNLGIKTLSDKVLDKFLEQNRLV